MINIIRSFWFYLNGVISTFLIGLLVISLSFFDKKNLYMSKFVRIWANWVCKSSGINIEVFGSNKLSKNENYIFVSNHESILDIPIAISTLPCNIVFLAKKELFKIPFFSSILNSLGMIKVDRKNKEEAYRSVENALNLLSLKNTSILVYPEGTRSNPGQILEFKKGSFILAIQSGLSLVPITIRNSGTNLPANKNILNDKINIQVQIHKPIKTTKLDVESDKDDLCFQAKKIISDVL